MHPSQLRIGQWVRWTMGKRTDHVGRVIWVEGEPMPAEVDAASGNQVHFLRPNGRPSHPVIVRVTRSHAKTGRELKPAYYAPNPVRLVVVG